MAALKNVQQKHGYEAHHVRNIILSMAVLHFCAYYLF